jgi:hypothetical protein
MFKIKAIEQPVTIIHPIYASDEDIRKSIYYTENIAKFGLTYENLFNHYIYSHKISLASMTYSLSDYNPEEHPEILTILRSFVTMTAATAPPAPSAPPQLNISNGEISNSPLATPERSSIKNTFNLTQKIRPTPKLSLSKKLANTRNRPPKGYRIKYSTIKENNNVRSMSNNIPIVNP